MPENPARNGEPLLLRGALAAMRALGIRPAFDLYSVKACYIRDNGPEMPDPEGQHLLLIVENGGEKYAYMVDVEGRWCLCRREC